MSTNQNKTPGLAAIYVRTSSEHQGEKSSPEEQEKDCRKLAEERGLIVVDVYRDTERYRVKRKLVDPSGTRSDRPALVAMLNDATAGKFNTILAWREDRLYRGMRAMLYVLETIQEYKLEVFLARETFDAKMAPLKAWVAGMELDGMRERMDMGVKARLRAGKANTGQDRYGYRREGEQIVIVEEEAQWVRQIFEWFNQKTPLMEIRQRLIQADAPQKGCSIPRKIRWSRSVIQGILKSAQAYVSGIKIQTRKGEVFEIPAPPIIDQATYQRFLEVRRKNKTYPAHHKKYDYLAGGMIFCECGRKWQGRVTSYTRQNRKGQKVQRKTYSGTYYCPQNHEEVISPNCPRTIARLKVDTFIWEEVSKNIFYPDVLLAEARLHIDQLRKQAEENLADKDRLQSELDNITMERQWVITQARKGKISSDDMDYQLGALTFQELEIKREMVAYQQIVDLRLLDNWDDKVREYFRDLQEGIESLNTAPQSDEERREIFEYKRRIVLLLVEKVTISKDRELQIIFRLNLLDLLGLTEKVNAIQMVGTCTRKPASPAHRRPGAGGG
jgi:site-specific DNA recombinase